MAILSVTPKTGTVGDVLNVSGKGLARSKVYSLLFAGQMAASFVSTTAGSVPEGTKLTVPEVPTTGPKGELGTKVTIGAVSEVGGEATSSAEFELQASVRSEAETAYLGDQVVVHGKGLLTNEVYQVSLISPGYIPYASGIMETGPNGSGTTPIVVPDYIGAGAFKIDLLNRKGAYPALQKSALIRILGFSYESLTAGRPQKSTGGLRCPVRITIPFRNKSSITFLPVVYAIIYNESGQPIQITSSGAGLQPHSSSDVVFCFPNLQKGKYRIGVFATTGTGRVLSKVYTFSLRV